VTDAATSVATTVNAAATALQIVDGSMVSVSSPGIANLAIGANATKVAFVNMVSVNVTGGAGAATITQDTGTGTITAGTGAMDVTGGSGADAYLFHAGAGNLTIEDFSATKGDGLTIDQSLLSSASIGSDGNGGLLLSFGSAAGSIDLKHTVSVPFSAIHFS
jgi:Ca2+-binding RTX toxin-like protein